MGETPEPERSPISPEVEGRKVLYGRLSAAWHHAKEGIPIPGWVALDVDSDTVSLKPTGGSDQVILTHTQNAQGVNGVSAVCVRAPKDTAQGFERKDVNFSVQRNGLGDELGTIVTRPYVWDEDSGVCIELSPVVEAFGVSGWERLTSVTGNLPEAQAATEDN